jgi:hypothetical protein
MGMNDFLIGIRTNRPVGRNDNGAQIQTWLPIAHKQNYKYQSKINAKVPDHRQRRLQREALRILEDSEIYEPSFHQDLGVSRHQNRWKMSSVSQDLDHRLVS